MKYSKCGRLVLVILLMAALLTACLPAGTGTERDNYGVTLSSFHDHGDCLKKENATTDLKRGPDPLPAELTKKLTVNGTTYTLEYKSYERLGEEFLYQSSDEKVEAEYKIDSLQPERIEVKQLDISFLETISQTELTQWLQDFASQFMQEDWSSYQEIHDTSYTTESEKGVSGHGYDGFKTEFAENEKLTLRSLTYRKQHNGFNTTDNIHFVITSHSVSISLNNHDFDNCQAVVDEEAVKNAVTEYIYANVNDGYTLVNIEWSNMTLIYKEDNLVLICSTTIHYTVKDKLGKDRADEGSYTFIVDIPDV